MMGLDWTSLESTAKKIVTVFVFLASAVLAVLVLPKVLVILLPFIFAYVISAAASPLMKLFKKIHLPRQAGAAISIILIAAVFFGLIAGILYKAGSELYGFAKSLPALYESALDTIDNLQGYILALPIDISAYLDGIGEKFGDILSSVSSTIVNVIPGLTVSSVKTVSSVLIGMVFTILASFFMLLDRNTVKDTIKNLLGPGVSGHISDVKSDLVGALGGYVRAQFILMGITFCELFVGLSVLNVKYSFILAILIAIVDAIPIFGTGTVLLPWALISLLSGSYRMALGLLITYAVCLTVRQLLEPKIISSQIGLHPLFTLFSMYVGFRLIGLLGMILGPVVAIIIKNFLRRRNKISPKA